MKCSWREASTLILTAVKKSAVHSSCNYELLTLRRSSKSSFMPNGYVFPGGTTEPADSEKVWIDFFSHFNVDLNSASKITGKVPPIVEAKTGKIPKLLSLKITAIRETFEETGILLCKNQDYEDSQKWASCMFHQDLNSWRVKIQKDAAEFFNMCKNLNCYPDVNNLHLWSNWLTPTSMGTKRFDTMFFIASLSDIPDAVADKTEIEKLSWTPPSDLMELCNNKEIWLPPPQIYEIARLLQFQDINILNNFSQDRSVQGCERWMPIQKKTLNGSVSLLPGDEAYQLINFSTPTDPEEVNMSNEEFRHQFKVLHRMEFLEKIKTKIIVKNYSPTNSHVLPVSEF